MAGSSVSSVEGSYEGEDVQAAAPQPVQLGTAAEAIRIWDYFIGSNLGRGALRVVLASNAENAAVLFRLRLVARRFHSELPTYVAGLNFSGLNIPTLSDELFIPFSNLSLVDLSGCRLAAGTTGTALLVTWLSSPVTCDLVISRNAGFLGGAQPIDELEPQTLLRAYWCVSLKLGCGGTTSMKRSFSFLLRDWGHRTHDLSNDLFLAIISNPWTDIGCYSVNLPEKY